MLIIYLKSCNVSKVLQNLAHFKDVFEGNVKRPINA